MPINAEIRTGTTPETLGKFEYKHLADKVGNFTFKATFEAIDYYNSTESNIVTTSVYSNISLTINNITYVELFEPTTITGKLTDQDDDGIVGNVDIYVNDKIIGNVESGADGTFTIPYTFNNAGEYFIYATYYEDEFYRANVTSNVVSVEIQVPTMIEYVLVNDVEGKVVLDIRVYNAVTEDQITNAKVDLSGDITATDVRTNKLYKDTQLEAGEHTITVTFNDKDHFEGSTIDIVFNVTEDPAKVIAELNETVANQTEQIAALNETVANQTEQIEDLSSTIEDLNDTVAEQQDTIDSLADDLNEAYQQMEDLNRTVEDQQSQIDDLEETIEDLENQIDELNAIIQNITSPVNTKITINPITDAKYHDTILITGKLVDAEGKAVPGTINLSINGQKVTAEADTTGAYEYEYTINKMADVNITATYDGTEKYTPSNTNITIPVGKQDTSVIFDDIESIVSGDEVTITGQLLDGNGIGFYWTVKLLINNGRATVKTDKEGYFTYTTTLTKVGENNITGNYLESAKYNAGSGSTTVNVTPLGTGIVFDELVTVTSGETFTITGKLTDDNGNPVVGTIKLLLNIGRVTVKTDSEGVFTYDYAFSKVGINNITASYLGGNRYGASEANITVEVMPMDTTITLDAIQAVKKGENITVSGKVLDENGNPVSGTVKLIINNGRATVKTDFDGVFMYDFTANRLGTTNITASYIGGNRYFASYTN